MSAVTHIQILMAKKSQWKKLIFLLEKDEN